MQIHNSYYYSNCKFLHQLLLLIILGFSTACDRQKEPNQTFLPEITSQSALPVVNINSASVAELEKLPHIGEKTAREIVEYREKFGKLRKPEHLLLIRGISDQKFRELRNLIVAE